MTRAKVEPPDNLSPQDLRLFTLLSDGEFKTHADLRTCLWDELSESQEAVGIMVLRLRNKLKETPYDLVCERRRIAGSPRFLSWVYRLVMRIGR